MVNDVLVEGIEAKDRTFLSKKIFRNILENLLNKLDDSGSLSKAVKSFAAADLSSLNTMDQVDSRERKFTRSQTTSVLTKRCLFYHKKHD